METKLPSGTLDRLGSDSHHWRGGMIYFCRDDPRFIVPKKPKWGGWTLNFAHASVWLVLLSCLLSVSVPTVWLFSTKRIGAAICYELGIVVFWCLLSAILSSPKRYENAA